MKRQHVTAKKQTNISVKNSGKKVAEKTEISKIKSGKNNTSVVLKSNSIKSKSPVKSKSSANATTATTATKKTELSLKKVSATKGVNPAEADVRDKSRILAKKVKDTSKKPRGRGQVNSRAASPYKADLVIDDSVGLSKEPSKNTAIRASLEAPLPSMLATPTMTTEELARSANNPDFQQAMASVNAEVFKAKSNAKPLVFPPPPAEFRPPRSSLSNLVLENRWKELEKRLRGKVDPNSRDEKGLTASWTPLYWSVKLGRVECVRLLLSFGADVNMVISDIDECSGTVLDLVSIRGDSAMEAVLREHVRKDEISINQAFRAIRTKLRGRAPAFNFRQYAK